MEEIKLQAEQEYNISLNGAELMYFLDMLYKKPYEEVAVTIEKMSNQIKAQI